MCQHRFARSAFLFLAAVTGKATLLLPWSWPLLVYWVVFFFSFFLFFLEPEFLLCLANKKQEGRSFPVVSHLAPIGNYVGPDRCSAARLLPLAS